MRLSVAAIASLLLPLVAGAPPLDPVKSRTSTGDDDAVPAKSAGSTIFNDKEVPPIVDLDSKTYEDVTSKGYWLVKAFSPYCPHCMSLAPKWQTLYEFYYTLNPLPASNEVADPRTSLNSFSRYFNFKWASIDCSAFGDACEEMEVVSYPTMILFKDGIELERIIGDLDMKQLSTFIENALEKIRPGSRPKDGVQLPRVGAKKAPEQKPLSGVQVHSKPEQAPADGFKKPSRTKATPNVDGKSVVFTADTFEKNVTSTIDPWFVKFYAPWCHHCQALAPIWEQLASEMKGKLNVGEVNCEVERKLCASVDVSAYPTVLYMQGRDRIGYNGMRGLGDFLEFAGKAVEAAKGIPDVTLAEFEAMEQRGEEVIFVYFYSDSSTTSSDEVAAMERLPMHLVSTGSARLVKSSDAALASRFHVTSFPHLLVSRDGRATSYPRRTHTSMQNVPKMTKWMQSVWLPLVPELSTSNARQVMRGKYVVLGVLSRTRPDDFAAAKRELKAARLEWVGDDAGSGGGTGDKLAEMRADRDRNTVGDADEDDDDDDNKKKKKTSKLKLDPSNPADRAHRVAFAWVDAGTWERWLSETYGVAPVSKDVVIVTDNDNHKFYPLTPSNTPIQPTRVSILTTLAKILPPSGGPPQLAAQTSGSGIVYAVFRTHHAVSRSPGLTLFSLASFMALAVWGWKRARRRMVGASVQRRARAVSNGAARFFSDGELGLANGKVD